MILNGPKRRQVGDRRRSRWRRCLLAWVLAGLALQPGLARADDAQDRELARAEALADRGSELEKQGHYDEAIPLTAEALAIREKRLGPNDPVLAKSLNNLAALYFDKGRFTEAEPAYRRAIAITEQARGPDDPDIATLAENLANVYRAQARYKEAEALANRALAIREKAFGADHPEVAQTLNALGAIDFDQGHYAEAVAQFRRSLAISQKAAGPDDLSNANTLNNLAAVYEAQGKSSEAEPLYRQGLAIVEKALGPEHPDVALLLTNLGKTLVAEGHFAEAEPALKRGIAIREKALGPEHPLLGDSLEDLAQLYYFEGRSSEAEPLYKRSLELRLKALGPDNPAVATTLSNLATALVAEGRCEEAEPLFRRSLVIREQALGPEHPDLAISLNNLGDCYRTERRFAAAEPLFQRSITIWEKAVGPDHPDLARALNNLADVYRGEGRFTDAEPLFKRALDIFEKQFGEDHPMVALLLNNLAALYTDEGRDAEAEPLYRRSLAVARKIYGPEHHDIAYALWNLAALCRKEQRIAEARTLAAEAVAIVAHRISAAGNNRSEGARGGDQREFRQLFLISAALSPAQGDAPALPLDDSFRVAQLAQASTAARAVAGMAARFAAGSDALAARVRQRQDLAQQAQSLDNALVQAASKAPGQHEAGAEDMLRQRLATANAQLDTLDAGIARDFPAYAELSNPQPMELSAAQTLLAPDEALLVYLVGNEESWLWAVRHDRAVLYRLAIGGDELTRTVAALRERLDPELNPDRLAFDIDRADALYRAILAPAEPLLQGARFVLTVPDGALDSLPFGVLVTRTPQTADDARDTAWFARDHASAVLPSVGALRGLRRFTDTAHATQPFVGIGDPVLAGSPAGTRGGGQAALFRGAVADVAAVRQLPPLPETADELHRVATAMGAGDDDLYLASRASEPVLRKAGLEHYRVVEFATHGLMSGDLPGLAEPALVLTPPPQASPDNDGLLTASKIATLKLDADWVVLSACNTAASDGTPDAGGLSGLAKAFFYAGARSILVSHWSVPSQATVRLVTQTFDELKKDPSIGRAEALRRAEMGMLAPDSPPEFAHPMFWAPFVLAGEGGAGH